MTTKKQIDEPRTTVACIIADYALEGLSGAERPELRIEKAIDQRLKNLQEEHPYDVVRIKHQSLCQMLNKFEGKHWLDLTVLVTFEW